MLYRWTLFYFVSLQIPLTSLLSLPLWPDTYQHYKRCAGNRPASCFMFYSFKHLWCWEWSLGKQYCFQSELYLQQVKAYRHRSLHFNVLTLGVGWGPLAPKIPPCHISLIEVRQHNNHEWLSLMTYSMSGKKAKYVLCINRQNKETVIMLPLSMSNLNHSNKSNVAERIYLKFKLDSLCFIGLWYTIHRVEIQIFSIFWKKCGFTVIAAGRNASFLSNWQGYFVYADGDSLGRLMHDSCYMKHY